MVKRQHRPAESARAAPDPDPATEKGVGGAQAIRRAIDVVRAVGQLRTLGASLSRVAQSTGLATSTTFRILRTLTEERLLRYDETQRLYYIGPLAFELGLAASSGAQVQAQWRDRIETIARQTRFTTYLMAQSGAEAVCLLCVQGSTAIRAMPIEIGHRLPLGIGAGSLAILSTLDDEEVRTIVESHKARLDAFPGGRRQKERIYEGVKLARTRGYSLTDGSTVAGLVGVGVPILPRRGMTRLAISISAAASDLPAPEARQVAQTISAAIKAQVK